MKKNIFRRISSLGSWPLNLDVFSRLRLGFGGQVYLVPCTLCLVVLACGRFGDKPSNEKKDGKRRIVCVSKQLNEIIFAVGGDTALVGVDISSTYPPAAKKITTVGYHRALNAEGIISLNPSSVWHDGNIAPPQVIEQIKKVGIPMRQFSGGSTIDSTKLLIMQVAHEFHNDEKGKEINQKLDADMAKL